MFADTVDSVQYLMVTISVCISDRPIHMMSILCVTSIPFMSNLRALVNRDVACHAKLIAISNRFQ